LLKNQVLNHVIYGSCLKNGIGPVGGGYIENEHCRIVLDSRSTVSWSKNHFFVEKPGGKNGAN
jgi:hypothetical protein